jgi:hypothetical protein
MSPQSEQTLMEKEIDELYRRVRDGEKQGKRIAFARRVVAYLLKVVAGGGSLVVATGYFRDWHQLIGVAILVAIFLDTISSNYKRLIAEAKAGYAYEFLREKVSRKYNRQVAPLLDRKKRPETAEAAQSEIDALQQAAHMELSEGLAQIRESIVATDLKALEALALDNERAAMQQGGKP